MKKADISMNIIVYAAIALLILVILVAFTTGRLGGLFKGINQQSGEEIGTIRSTCTSDCNLAKTSVQSSGTGAWKSSAYCTRTYGYDSDGDGDVKLTEYYHCWDNQINIDCSIAVSSTTECKTDEDDGCICPTTTADTGDDNGGDDNGGNGGGAIPV